MRHPRTPSKRNGVTGALLALVLAAGGAAAVPAQASAQPSLPAACVDQVDTSYYLVNRVDGVETLRVPITSGVARLFFQFGLPGC